MSAAKPDMLDETIPDEPVEPSASTEPNIIRIILADSQAIYRVGMRKIFALEDDIRVVAQVDNLQNLESAIQRFPTDLVILEGGLISGTTDAIPAIVRRNPQVKIIIQAVSHRRAEHGRALPSRRSRHHSPVYLAGSAGQMRPQDRAGRDLDR